MGFCSGILRKRGKGGKGCGGFGGADGRLVHMRFCKSLAVVVLGLGCAVAARAQAGVYLGYTATRLSGIKCFEVAPVTCSSLNGVVNPAGVQAGAYYDFKTLGPARLGVDLRGGTFHSNKSATADAGSINSTDYTNFLVGLKGSFHTRFSWLSPYAQVSTGYALSNATEPFTLGLSATATPTPRVEDSFIEYMGIVGFALRVFPNIDLRPIELGIGNMNRIAGGSSADGPASVGVMTIGASIVLHTSPPAR